MLGMNENDKDALCERKDNQVGMQFLNKNEKNKWSGYDLHQSRPWEEKRAVGWFQ